MTAAEVARAALAGVESEVYEVVADAFTAMVKSSLSQDPRHFAARFHEFLTA
ncbi:hypothetical protein ABZ839_19170 [Streptomyces cellulosae]